MLSVKSDLAHLVAVLPKVYLLNLGFLAAVDKVLRVVDAEGDAANAHLVQQARSQVGQQELKKGKQKGDHHLLFFQKCER